MIRSIYRFLKDRAGVSALEFALIAPVMLILYLGCIELAFMMRSDRTITVATSTLGDLTARLDVAAQSDIDDIFAAVGFIFTGTVTEASSRMRVSSLIADANGAVTVVWSDATRMGARAPGSVVTVPNGIVSPGGSVIMAEIEFDYDRGTGLFIKDGYVLDDTFYLRPRRSGEVGRDNGRCVLTSKNPC